MFSYPPCCPRQGVKRHTAAAAADVFCWRAEADEGSPRTAYKNTAGARQIERNTRPVALIIILFVYFDPSSILFDILRYFSTGQ